MAGNVLVCVCVCVREREREEAGRGCPFEAQRSPSD